MNAQRLKSYMALQKLVAKKFGEARKSKFVFWSSLGAAIHILSGFDEKLVPVYPQLKNLMQGKNHVADAIQMATYQGYNSDLCSDLRCEIGNQYIVDDLRPKLPKPNFILALNFMCYSSIGLFNSWIQQHPGVDHFIIDSPPVVGDYISHGAVEYVKEQFLELIEKLQRVLRIPFDKERFRSATVRSARSFHLYNSVLMLAAHNPSPISLTSFQPFLIPLSYYHQYDETYNFVTELKQELEHIIATSTEQKERIRLCWDFLPFYKYMPEVEKLFNEYGAKVVIGTSLAPFPEWPGPELFETTDDPIGLLAYGYVQHLYKRDYKYKSGVISSWIRAYKLDGVIFHSARNCKMHSLNHFLVKEELEREFGIPTVVFEADCLDPQAYSKAQVFNRLEAFLETF